jgi:hypothetical protein
MPASSVGNTNAKVLERCWGGKSKVFIRYGSKMFQAVHN